MMKHLFASKVHFSISFMLQHISHKYFTARSYIEVFRKKYKNSDLPVVDLTIPASIRKGIKRNNKNNKSNKKRVQPSGMISIRFLQLSTGDKTSVSWKWDRLSMNGRSEAKRIEIADHRVICVSILLISFIGCWISGICCHFSYFPLVCTLKVKLSLLAIFRHNLHLRAMANTAT